MLQAPTSDSKRRNETSNTAAEREPQRELHPRSGVIEGVSGPGTPASAARSGPARLRSHFSELQRTLGNQAVLRMLGRSNQTQSLTPSSGTTPILQRKSACDGSDGECGSCKEKREDGLLRDKPAGRSGANTAPPIVHEALRSPGQPLDCATRTFVEPRLEYDFSDVHVHTDAKAGEPALAANAQAYTFGSNIVFGPGRSDPPSVSGRRLFQDDLVRLGQQASMSSGPIMQTQESSSLVKAVQLQDDTGTNARAF